MTTTARYLTTEDMAAATGKTREFWARVCKAGTIAAVKLGNDWHVSLAEFERFMAGGKTAVARPGRKTARQARRSA